MIAVPVTFAPAGEPALPRGKRNQRVCRMGDRQRTGSGVPPRKRQVGQKRARFRLRQVFGLVDVLLGLLSVASRARRVQCM
jgi:hypothetical protein